MYRSELQKLEGVWTGIERIDGDEGHHEAHGRWEFHTVFDGRFLVCDYIQTAPDRPTSVGHGVFRQHDDSDGVAVSWFRSPAATASQQGTAVASGDQLVFVETIGARATRTTYTLALDRLRVCTECSMGGGEWKPVLEGT